MKVFYEKHKQKLSLMLALVLLFQIVGPMLPINSFAEGVEGEEVVEIITEEGELLEEPETTEEASTLEPEEEVDKPGKDDELDPADGEEPVVPGEGEVTEEPEAIEAPDITGMGILEALEILAATDDFEFLTGVTITDEKGDAFTGPVKKDSEIRIQYNYKIEDGLVVDTTATYTVNIPDEIEIISEMKIKLEKGGLLIATVSIGTNNVATIIFDENVNNEKINYNRTGYFFVFSKFDEEEIGLGGTTEIEFDLGGESKDIVTVDFEKTEIQKKVTLTKSGSYNKEKNEIIWNVVVKPETTPKGYKISDVVITDTIQEGQTYIENSASISPAVTSGSFDVTEDIITYSFNEEIEDGDTYTITFSTKPNISAFDREGKYIEFKNLARSVWEDNGSSLSNEAKVSTTVDFIDKTGKYDSSNKKIDWTITINNNYLSIANAVITDTIPTGLELIENSIKLNNISISIGDNLTYAGKVLTYTFGAAINTKQTLTFSTDVVDPGAYNSNESMKFTNTVEITGNGVPSGASSTSPGVGVTTSVINKVGAGYNSSTQEITWRITVNSNKINIKNAKVTDQIPTGLEYVNNSFSISPTVDGSFEIVNGEITYQFNQDISNTYTIEFRTKVLDNNIWANNKIDTFNNTAYLTGDNIPNSKSTGTQNVVSTVIKKTNDGYDHLNRKAKWKIVINQNNMPITNAVVTDIIGDYQELVEGSVEIVGPSKDNATDVYDAETKTLTIVFTGVINEQHTITFETLVDEDIFYENDDQTISNTATLDGNELPTNGVSSTATKKINNTIVSKTGKYTNGRSYIDWIVYINQNQLPISNVKLEDSLQEGLQLDTSSVKLTELEVNKDGGYTDGTQIPLNSDNIKYSAETRVFEFVFREDINKAYRLDFRTDIEDDYRNTTFTNKIEFKGSSKTYEDTTAPITVKFQTGGGGADGTPRGSITVIKVDEDDNLLSGAIFELLDSFGNVIKTSGETENDGVALFDKLKLDVTYSIREKVAPEGYEISDEVYEFMLTSLEGKRDISYDFENINIKGNIEFTKTGEDNDEGGLSGAKFGLYELEDIGFESYIVTATSNEDGLVEFTDISYGSYKIKEIEAPVNYQLSTEILDATITVDGVTVNPTYNDVVIEEVANTKIRGNIEFTKHDEDNNPLKGAIFELYDKDDEGFKNPIDTAKSNDQGIVSFKDVEYGSYIIKETKSPEGYNLNDTELEVSITEDGVTVNPIKEGIKNTRIRGSLEIFKVARGTEKPLKGASFALYSKGGTLIDEKTTDDNGKVVFDGLLYGDYYFIETKAPSGYIKNGDPVELSIVENKVTVEYIVENRAISDKSDPEGRIRIIKKDSDTRELLAGAEFNIINSKGKVVDTLTTNKKGEAVSAKLPVGRYTIEETDAPEGYELSEDVVDIKVIDGVTIEVVIYNEKIEPVKPVDPVKPVEPVDPGTPATPIDPSNPGNPEIPGEDNPDEFEEVDGKIPEGTTSGQPEKPTSGQPEKPTLPKTGQSSSLSIMIAGLGLVVVGILLKRKTVK